MIKCEKLSKKDWGYMKVLLISFVFVISTSLMGQIITIDNIDGIPISYHIDETRQVSVVKCEKADFFLYSGKLVIPSYVMYNDTKYFVTSIADEAFKEYGLSSVVIPNTVKYIGSYAFWGSGLQEVRLPKRLITIGFNAFNNTKWYDKQSNGPIYINKTLYDYKALAHEIQQSFSDEVWVYKVLPSNTQLIIPKGCVWISDHALSDCLNLISVDIPKTVRYVGQFAFARCLNMTHIIVHWKRPLRISEDALKMIDFCRCTLIVPKGCKARYQQAEGWKGFKEIIEQ